MAQQKQIRLGTMRLQVQPLALLSGLRTRHCCELWCRPAAVALTQPLAWEPLYAVDVALKRQKTKKKKKKNHSLHLYSNSYLLKTVLGARYIPTPPIFTTIL